VAFSDEMRTGERDLKRFMYANLYHHPRQIEAAAAAHQVVAGLFAAFSADPATLPAEWRASLPVDEPGLSRHIADYIAGMTDRYAIREYQRVVGPVTMPDGF
jgi:dGTPase